MVKKREQYRPFAPSVLEERVADFFEVPPSQTEFPFMIFVLRVREHARNQLGAITHVDGTARVQSVSQVTNPEYWKLIKEFENLTDIPILLNTSFNNNAEPIVDSLDDAVACFLTTGIDYLVVGNYLVTKKSSAEIRNAALTLIPQLPASRKLVKRNRIEWYSQTTEAYCAIESTKSRYFETTSFKISTDMFILLQAANQQRDVKALIDQSGISDDRIDDLAVELMELWSQRLVNLVPCS
jgi:carbamoyltransferase